MHSNDRRILRKRHNGTDKFKFKIDKYLVYDIL